MIDELSGCYSIRRAERVCDFREDSFGRPYFGRIANAIRERFRLRMVLIRSVEPSLDEYGIKKQAISAHLLERFGVPYK